MSYERSESTTTTQPDGTSTHHQVKEGSTSGLAEVLLLPVGLTITAVTCWLILQIGVRIGHSINPPEPSGTSYLVHEK